MSDVSGMNDLREQEQEHERARSAARGEAAISLRGVVKRYGSIVAVNGLDLEVPTGVCFGLLGPNGAGKSTTMRMLTAQTLADEGELSVLGYRLPGESKQSRLEMGVVPQLDNLDVELTCRQILTVYARLYRVTRGERAAAVQRALQIANLLPRADTIVRELSGGMRRRLLVARGLIHQPRLVLLDEPTVGLDPQVRQELWSLIDELRTSGVTALMSTHYIEEAERLADTVAVMNHGQVVAQGTPAELVREHAGEQVVEVYGSPAHIAQVSELAAEKGWSSRRSGPAVAIMHAETLDGAAPEGVRRPANLEDAFVALTGEEIE
jgi:lipooligosaccharide transport system ATP-binding protein